MIRARKALWPIPTDTVLDRSRTLARALLAALEKADPPAARAIVDQAQAFGELWLTPQLDTVGGQRRLTVTEAAALVGRQPPTIRQWISRGTRHGHLVRYPDGIDERELLDLDTAMKHGAPTQGAAPKEGTHR